MLTLLIFALSILKFEGTLGAVLISSFNVVYVWLWIVLIFSVCLSAFIIYATLGNTSAMKYGAMGMLGVSILSDIIMIIVTSALINHIPQDAVSFAEVGDKNILLMIMFFIILLVNIIAGVNRSKE